VCTFQSTRGDKDKKKGTKKIVGMYKQIREREQDGINETLTFHS
jgi:hypothetical protein